MHTHMHSLALIFTCFLMHTHMHSLSWTLSHAHAQIHFLVYVHSHMHSRIRHLSTLPSAHIHLFWLSYIHAVMQFCMLSFTWILVRLSFPPLMHFHINLLIHALSLTLSHALSYACILESTCLHALVHCYMHHSSTPCAWTHSGPLPRILSCTQSIMWLSFQSSWMSVTRSAML